jgi:hypothetical protein
MPRTYKAMMKAVIALASISLALAQEDNPNPWRKPDRIERESTHLGVFLNVIFRQLEKEEKGAIHRRDLSLLVGQPGRWRVTYRATPLTIIRVESIGTQDDLIRLQVQSTYLDELTLTNEQKDDIKLLSAGDLTLDPPLGNTRSGTTKRPGKCFYALPKVTGTASKKDAEVSLSGGMQAAENAKPLYYWEASVKAPCFLPIGIVPGAHTLIPLFQGSASQQSNADPDTMLAGIDYVYRRAFSPRIGVIVNLTALSYEFSRKLSEEAIIESGELGSQEKIDKNANLRWAALPEFTFAPRFVNVAVAGGIEFGRVQGRTIRPQERSEKESTFARPMTRVNLFRQFGAGRLTLDATHTLRLPQTAEPFRRKSENGGKAFLTTKPRHHVSCDADIQVVTGLSLSLKYRYGSLPPNFLFLDHQFTAGFAVLLKR